VQFSGKIALVAMRLLHVRHGDDGARYRTRCREPDEPIIREQLKGDISRCTVCFRGFLA